MAIDYIADYFGFRENNTNLKTETLAGLTTFMTMSYIIFVQPAILGAAGMDKGAVMVATCIAAAVSTILMGLLTNYPIALAPAMGHNVFFAVVVCGIMGFSWQVALGAVFISGMAFLLLTFFNAWGHIISAIPECLKYGIAVGIGLFISFIGFQYGGLVVDTPGVLVGLGNLKSPPVMLTVIGTLITMGLYTKNIKGSILLGMLITCFVGILLNVVSYTGVVSAIPKIDATFMKLDIAGAFKAGIITVVFTFFFLDVFDTMGTLIGVTSQAGYIKDGKLPLANKAMLADAVGTVGGALLGTSTVTSYIESSTGIAQGGRTGFASIVTGVLFLVALFFSPLAEMIGGGYMVGDTQLYPVIAPALIIVGFLMMKSIGQINWNEVTEALPAFVVIITMPLTFSITDGIGFGIITYTFLMVVAKKSKEIHWLLYLITFLFLARYILT